MKLSLSKKEIVFFVFLAAFSSFLMFNTFQITPSGELKIATKIWSDFAATIPLVRSFSLGNNMPPQYPIFAGPPIRYHFLFFLFVGLFEKIGLRLDLALNTLSAISFFSLLAIIYLLAKTVFKKTSIACLSVILFLFNGSFAFVDFFKTHPISAGIISGIVQNKEFSSFGPYDGNVVSAFWSLNIFTNQRHLAFAYFAFLLLIYLMYKSIEKRKISKEKIIGLTLLVGLFPFFHLAVFGMMEIALVVFLFLYPKYKKQIIIIGFLSVLIALPQILYMGMAEVKTSIFAPGYLIEKLTIVNFFHYWIMNLGLVLLLAPLGFYFATRNQKKLILPFLTLFVVGNLFRFSPEIAANHKFFNLFLIGANIFTAFFLYNLWHKQRLGKILVGAFFPLLILSGLIDFFPIVNDGFITIPDFRKNPTASFIYRSTPKEAVFLNAAYLYDPASLAGRKIYLGWPYFSWSAGYDTDSRFLELKEMLSPKNKFLLCEQLNQRNISYVEIQNPTPIENVDINYSFFEENFIKIFEDGSAKVSIFDVRASCI